MKQIIWVSLFLAVLLGFVLSSIPCERLTYEKPDVITISEPTFTKPLEPKLKPRLNTEIRAYLQTKRSPLASHTDLLLEQEHWKLIIAISAIESSYCIHQLNNNCWGITDSDGSYKSYASFDDAIVDANGLITRWQARGRWLTVEDMNCHYVVPCNPNWVTVVKSVLSTLEFYEQRDRQVSKP